MNTEQFVEAIKEMDPEIARCNFEALMCLALSTEEAEQQQQGETDEAN
jgi:hypothetical protein